MKNRSLALPLALAVGLSGCNALHRGPDLETAGAILDAQRVVAGNKSKLQRLLKCLEGMEPEIEPKSKTYTYNFPPPAIIRMVD